MKPMSTEIVVLGAGPGGYAAAFYAADKGKKVILVEKENRLGGVCLIRGCIPSKALLNATQLISDTAKAGHRGISFESPKIDIKKLYDWKETIVNKLSEGIDKLAELRGVQVLKGRGYFEDSQTLRVETTKGQEFIKYQKAIVAVGSKSALPAVFDLGNKRIMTSREALNIEEIPKTLLVVGGGYIGMELGTVYAKLGSQVVLVEALDSILTGADSDLVRPVKKVAEETFKEIRVKTKVQKMATKGKKIEAFMETEGSIKSELYDRVLVAIGRVPNCKDLGLENTKVERDDKGYIKVNDKQQTADPNIYAIGDVAGGLLLAHKATKEARIAVDVISGEASVFDSIVPAVVFTDPELAWCGLTEIEAKQKNIPYEIARFPWAASGRALTYDRTDGVTKLIIEPETERILGVGICGHGAGELISEGVFAIEMGSTARDLAESIHPHPTLSETLMECAEMYYGFATHALGRKKPAKE